MENFDKIYNREMGFMVFAFILSVIVMIVLSIQGLTFPPIVGTMMWTTLVGMSVLKVIKSALEELKK